jgi:hypothetical protein
MSKKVSVGFQGLCVFRRLEKSKTVSGVLYDFTVKRGDSEAPGNADNLYFVPSDTINVFSSIGLHTIDAEAIKKGILLRRNIYVDSVSGDMLIGRLTYKAAFNSYFNPDLTPKKALLKIPKNEGAITIVVREKPKATLPKVSYKAQLKEAITLLNNVNLILLRGNKNKTLSKNISEFLKKV